MNKTPNISSTQTNNNTIKLHGPTKIQQTSNYYYHSTIQQPNSSTNNFLGKVYVSNMFLLFNRMKFEIEERKEKSLEFLYPCH